MSTRTDVLIDALERLEGYEYLDMPGPFACHGPMGAEALSTLGFDDLVSPWVEGYKSRHQPIDPFAAASRIDPSDDRSWRPALGDLFRVGDWAACFVNALSDEPWPDVVRRWCPRLLAGYAGGLTHGIIRVAHAVRALPDDGPPPAPLLRELARALAFWAALYTPLPGRPELRGTLDLEEAISRLPRPVEKWAAIEAGTFSRIGELAGFPEAIEALGLPSSDEGALNDLSTAFCRVLLSNPEVDPFPLVHTVTPIGAARILEPYLPQLPARNLYAQLWQVNAAILCGFTSSPLGSDAMPDPPGEPLSPADLAGLAAEHRDPHVVKFTEVCLREHARRPDPVYLLAANSLLRRTAPW